MVGETFYKFEAENEKFNCLKIGNYQSVIVQWPEGDLWFNQAYALAGFLTIITCINKYFE